jgi:hypothetical protein
MPPALPEEQILGIQNLAITIQECIFVAPSPRQKRNVKKMSAEWKIYRTRFLIKARQLTEPLVFVDAIGREHHGQPGDYLVESSDGSMRIAPQLIFEDIYIAMGPNRRTLSPPGQSPPVSALKRRVPPRPLASA